MLVVRTINAITTAASLRWYWKWGVRSTETRGASSLGTLHMVDVRCERGNGILGRLPSEFR
jgi:hypothetical protein